MTYSVLEMCQPMFDARAVPMDVCVQNLWNECCGSGHLRVGGGWSARACCSTRMPSRVLPRQGWHAAWRVVMKCWMLFLHGAAACKERSRGGIRACVRLAVRIRVIGSLKIRPNCMWRRCAGEDGSGMRMLYACAAAGVKMCGGAGCAYVCRCAAFCSGCQSQHTLLCCWSGRPPGIVCA